jgi:hypothetical protein
VRLRPSLRRPTREIRVNAGWRIAAPSLVQPDALDANCRALAGRVDEVCLTLYETDSCLAYSSSVLAPDLAGLPGRNGAPLRYHAHLPLDLPWRHGAARVAEAVVALAEKCAYLNPEFFVLHPPDSLPENGDAVLFQAFILALRDRNFDPGQLLVENIETNDLGAILPLAEAAGCGLCFDIGHAQAFAQERLLDRPEAARMLRCLHLYAPHAGPDCPTRINGGHGHYSLRKADEPCLALLAQTLDLAAAVRDARDEPDFAILLEVFSWSDLDESMIMLAELPLAPNQGTRA